MERSTHPGDSRALSFGVFILFPGESKEQWDYKERDGRITLVESGVGDRGAPATFPVI